jgi:hypothetical protein
MLPHPFHPPAPGFVQGPFLLTGKSRVPLLAPALGKAAGIVAEPPPLARQGPGHGPTFDPT